LTADAARIARRPWRALEPIHGMIYFVPEARSAYAGIGLTHHRTGYFASRSAALGPVPAEVVIATFFNFYPGLVRRALAGVWDVTTPAQVLDARLSGADQALRRAFGEAMGSAELVELAGLARAAALAACDELAGRPLFAGHAALSWPDEPHLVLWHAQTLLREFRGDGHVALLRAEGLTGVEALVMHAATGDVPAEVLQRSRSWPQEDWDAAVESLRARGLLEAGTQLTEAGRAHREHVERRTDELAAGAYSVLDDADAEQLVQLGRRFSRLVVDAGLLRIDPQQWAMPDP
jgi:Helix-turn-helix family